MGATSEAVLAHGSGSHPDFLHRAFGPALADAGLVPTLVPDRSGNLGHLVKQLHTAVSQAPGQVLVGGVSLGAHAAVAYALSAAGQRAIAAHQLLGLLLVMPAWTGAPGAVAKVSAVAADTVAREGIADALAGLQQPSGQQVGGQQASGWVLEELAAAWSTYSQAELAAALRATASSPGPTAAELARVGVPCGVVAVRDDPLHPVAVAQQWATLLPASALIRLDSALVGADRAVLGRAALEAWRRALPTGVQLSG